MLGKTPEPSQSHLPAHQQVINFGKYQGMPLGELAAQGGRAGLGYIQWLSTQKDQPLAPAAREVWEKHRPELTDEEVTDELADAADLDDLNGLWRCLTAEQQTTFKDTFANTKADLKGD